MPRIGFIHCAKKYGLVGVMLLIAGCVQHNIFQASRNGNYNRVKDLIRRNPDMVHAQDKDKWTPLHHAVEYGHRDVVKLLLDHGADPEAAADSGWTILKTVRRKDHKTIEKMILSAIEKKQQEAQPDKKPKP